jgi:hypothetical protein
MQLLLIKGFFSNTNITMGEWSTMVLGDLNMTKEQLMKPKDVLK